MNRFTRWFPSLYLLLNGLIYCYLAWLFVVEPLVWFERLGIQLRDPVGYTELKTTYIGLMGTLGLYSLLAVPVGSLRWAGLLLAALSYGLLALVRSWGIWVEGQSNEFLDQLLLIEAVSLALALLAMYCQRHADRLPRNPYH